MPIPTLTRRRYPERPDCWHIYYGDVQAGTIARRVGNPFDTDPWEWNCGFYPGSHPRECTNDTATSFDQARADFELAWAVFLSKRTEADFQKWRDQRGWMVEKYRRFDRGERTVATSRRIGLSKTEFNGDGGITTSHPLSIHGWG